MRGLAAIAVTACLTGCTDDDPPPASLGPPAICTEGTPEERSDCWTQHYLRGPIPAPLADCPGSPEVTPIDATREVSFFAAPGVSDVRVQAQGARLQGYYVRYTLSFFTAGPAAAYDREYAMAGTEAEYDAIPAAVGVEPGAAPTAEQEAEIDKRVGDIMFANIRAFAATHAGAPRSLVSIIVLQKVVSPYVASLIDATVVGLGVSPTFLENLAETDPSSSLAKLLSLPKDFPAMLFLGDADITRLAKNPAGTIAHEMGHALGLKHAEFPGNLMTQGQSGIACEAGLTPEQVQIIKRAADTAHDEDLFTTAKRAVVKASLAHHARAH